MITQTFKERFRAAASSWKSDHILESPDMDLDTDLIPEAWFVEAQSGFDVDEVDFPEIVSVDREEQEAIYFEIGVEDCLANAPPPSCVVSLTPLTNSAGLNVTLRIHRFALIPIAAELRTPNDIEAEALARWASSSLALDDLSIATLPNHWTDWIQREGYDLWLLRDAEYRCRECKQWFRGRNDEFHNHGSEHNVHIRCPNGHTIYYKTVRGPYRF